MPRQATIHDHEQRIRADMDKWAKYRQETSELDIGYPKQSAEQMSGHIRGTGDKFDQHLEVCIQIDQAINKLHVDLQRAIFCRYAIPLEYSDIKKLKIPERIMTQRQSAYFWSENYTKCVESIGLTPPTFDGILRHAIGKIEGLIYS